jgi:hypothetical protein
MCKVKQAVHVLTRHLQRQKVKQSHYRPEQAQRMDRGTSLSFHDLGARRGCVASITLRPLYPGKDPVPIVQEAHNMCSYIMCV